MILFSNRTTKQIAQTAYAGADALGVQVERVEKYCAHPGGARRQRVVRVRVADERGLRCLHAEPFEREPEDGRVGLLAADEVRVNSQVEEAAEPRRLKRVKQPPVLRVRDDGDEQPRALQLRDD